MLPLCAWLVAGAMFSVDRYCATWSPWPPVYHAYHREEGLFGIRKRQTCFREFGCTIRRGISTLGGLPALFVSPANEQDRAQVAEPAEQVREVTGE